MSDTLGISPAPSGIMLPLILSSWLSTGRHARLVCDDQQKILWHNDKIEPLVGRTGRFTIKNDRLIFASKNDQSTVSDFISRSDMNELAFWINDEEGSPIISVQCQRINLSLSMDFFGFRFVLNEDNLSADHIGFDRFFNLTRQEAIICKLMMEGRTVQEIVQIYGKSQDTVRFHVRNIYRKMNTSSREEFFATLRHFHFL